MIHATIFLAGVLGGVSLLTGVVIALIVVAGTQDVATALGWIEVGYYALVGLMPLALWAASLATRDDEDSSPGYSSPLRAVVTTLQGAAIGSILGAGPIFMAAVIYLPVMLANFQIDEFGPAVRDIIVWPLLLLAVGAAVASAIPLGLWVYYSRAATKDE